MNDLDNVPLAVQNPVFPLIYSLPSVKIPEKTVAA